MEPTPELSAKLKKVQFEILKVFVDICEKENLTYWLVAGTALGAVRHKGFIPWDDDIDVGMPRPDYERFMELAPKHLPEYYFLQNNITDPEYPTNFAKIRDSRTAFIETTSAHMNINHGIWIDIFPHDGYPRSGSRGRTFIYLNKLAVGRICKGFHTPPCEKDLKKRVLDVLEYIVFPTVKGAVKFREKAMRKYPYESFEKVINYSGAWGDREIMDRTTMGKGSEGVFEGLKVMLPEDYDKYLSTLYGDYMTPPPVEKQVSHHFAEVIDTEKSYKEYIK